MAEVWHVEDEDRELWGPSVDVCAWCGDCECDGIGCISSLDPDDESDHPAIEQLHAWIRRGRFFEQVERVLDQCENRPVRPKHGHREPPSEVADAIDGVTLDDGETTVTVSRAPRRHVADIDTDEDCWYWVACECGWCNGPFPGPVEAADEFEDHREFAAERSAP